ncbi:MAG TPA: peptidase dimerization domain-containing protein, partial [Burkholderiaceae bacterium]|nr:peptidase dimerization domain-containing protein [Burkholderiaceae bacterium]
ALQNQAKQDAGSRFDPPFSTLHVGTVLGGTAVNIISRHCEFSWDIRCLPDDDWRTYLQRFQAYADTLLPAMRAIAPRASIETEVVVTVPPLHDAGGAAQTLASELLDSGRPAVVPFVSEAGQFQERGLDVVVCGPGSINQAHQPDEYIEISQITAFEQFLNRLGDRLCEGH